MKKPYFHLRHVFAIVFLLAIFIIYSCRKESVLKVVDTTSKLDEKTTLIAEAKNYFNHTILKEDAIKTNGLNAYKTPIQLLTKTINWDSAYTQIISLGKIVVLPVRYKENNRIKVGVYELPVNSITRLFVYKDRKGVMHNEVVIRIPDTTYLNSKNNNKQFSGIINVYDWQGNFIKGILIKNGVERGLGAPEYIPNTGNAIQVAKLKTNSLTCTTYTWYSCARYGDGPTYCNEGGSYMECTGGGGGDNENDHQGPTGEDYGGGGGNGGGGGSESTYVSEADIANAVPVIEGPAPIDPTKFINCFTDGKTASQYKMTIYVDQPNPGSNAPYVTATYANGKWQLPDGRVFAVGHAFVGFEKINTDGTSVTQVMGFYPGGNGIYSQGVIKDDGEHNYSVSYTSSVNASQFNAALQLVVDNGNLAQYQLCTNSILGINEYNCTDAAIHWMWEANINVPVGTPNGSLNTSPGQYGQDLRSMPGVNIASSVSWHAPTSHGSCN